MSIEFHTPKSHVKEWILNFLMRRMLHLHKKNQYISKATVHLQDAEHGQKSCAIDLTIHGHAHTFYRRCSSFEEASLHVLSQVEEKLWKMVNVRN